jgi:Rap1a immunity proteins
MDACFVAKDHDGQALAYVYYEEEPGRRDTGISSGLCVPVGVSAQQAVRVVVEYIDRQSTARMNEDMRLLAFEALKAAWPCKK